MISTTAHIVRRLWQLCSVLRDDGLSYSDYVEQLTYLLFLKLADERRELKLPPRFAWRSFDGLSAIETSRHYDHVLSELAAKPRLLGVIFADAKNKLRDPAKLRHIITTIDEVSWETTSGDIKGDAYEGLLEKNARDTKSGFGQYFTARPLIDAIVECIAPIPGEVLCDPACGTGGFLLGAHRFLASRVSDDRQKEFLATRALNGVELVTDVARLAAMNLLLHGVTGSGRRLPIICDDSLAARPTRKVDVVLSNPPFGSKGSLRLRDCDKSLTQRALRRDFVAETGNKQLNFIQHIMSLLKPGGRAAIVIPDNVLFEQGAASLVRRSLMERCSLHTLLRLPTGLFYASGVKANVMFLERLRDGQSAGRFVGYYDLRTASRFSLRNRPLQYTDLTEFISFYRDRPKQSSARWRMYRRRDILADPACRLDLAWSSSETIETPAIASLEELADSITSSLERALTSVALIRGGGR